ncbi:MAG: class Ib ribonucleoside-diphosphate reductase assembly flavoprotein NrdI [Alkalibacterium sp.]|nr:MULTISPECIES: class Ib ribonucleoside-diphosphate reductase assembly flavoprotein NrdI [Alkalibacterium]MDN6293997.1 class Ib ribonucleoside-diphosphate reductase assembly flavoprotein NrdI [Alkalibacterium sp.]MDN6295620.1 class Ib ribonucleoside-diphosphate reductase assembly flavoprotein NrdI [Alkalibacterium sp.]MDN6327336.1 class Ib ribonucleoside-diphosphate reductase assembly flavoprotein NrdI [Alkalibacterium sp.]MDN6398544.1 class Ib ribonucleoside-diphosphate reductase assembly fla
MVIIYFSLTGQTRKFVDKLNMDVLELNPADPFVEINEPFIIVTPAYDKEVTEILNDFLETGSNIEWFKGVAGGGNINFGKLFAFTAKDIARDYNVPLLHTFEFQGNQADVSKLKKAVNNIGINRYNE